MHNIFLIIDYLFCLNFNQAQINQSVRYQFSVEKKSFLTPCVLKCRLDIYCVHVSTTSMCTLIGTYLDDVDRIHAHKNGNEPNSITFSAKIFFFLNDWIILNQSKQNLQERPNQVMYVEFSNLSLSYLYVFKIVMCHIFFSRFKVPKIRINPLLLLSSDI